MSYISTPTCLFETKTGWILNLHQKSESKKPCLSKPPEAMGFDLDLEVLPSTMDVWAIEEKAPLGRWVDGLILEEPVSVSMSVEEECCVFAHY